MDMNGRTGMYSSSGILSCMKVGEGILGHVGSPCPVFHREADRLEEEMLYKAERGSLGLCGRCAPGAWWSRRTEPTMERHFRYVASKSQLFAVRRWMSSARAGGICKVLFESGRHIAVGLMRRCRGRMNKRVSIWQGREAAGVFSSEYGTSRPWLGYSVARCNRCLFRCSKRGTWRTGPS